MNEKQKSEIMRMRKNGISFSKIAYLTGISRNTVKSFCRRNNVSVEAKVDNEDKESLKCKECGKELKIVSGKKVPKFCSKKCRMKWWKSHPESVNRKAIYTFICAKCGSTFTAYGNRNRKFCSHRCYINARFGGSNDE